LGSSETLSRSPVALSLNGFDLMPAEKPHAAHGADCWQPYFVSQPLYRRRATFANPRRVLRCVKFKLRVLIHFHTSPDMGTKKPPPPVWAFAVVLGFLICTLPVNTT